MWGNAVSNVAYYFSVQKSMVEYCLKQILDDGDVTPFQTFWFLRSLALNGNVSLKPFEEVTGPKQILTILRYYLKIHEVFKEPGSWISYDKIWANTKTKTLYRINPDLGYMPGISGYDVSWQSDRVDNYHYWDTLVYPVHHTKLKNKDICKAIWINWMMSLDKASIAEMNSYSEYAIDELFNNQTSLVKVYNRIGKDNPEFVRSCLMTNYGMNLLVNHYDYALSLSKEFFEKNGFVFNPTVPKMPYGFDYMASLNGISCYAKPVSLWKV